jgi:hypothetical protein
MPKDASPNSAPPDAYWDKRVRSPAFKRGLTTVVAHELRSLSRTRIQDVVPRALVRDLIREWAPRLVDRAALAEIIIQVNRRMGARSKRRRESILSLLDAEMVAELEALLNAEIELSPPAEELIAKMMRQEFVRQLFTDIIFTSIVSFNERVNPLFGALTMRALEERIKGFIQLFMPMIQEQATAFAVHRGNQRVLFDFSRAMVRHLLNEPLGHYATLMTSPQQKRTEALVRRMAVSSALDAPMRNAALAAWDDAYAAVRQLSIGDLLRLDQHAGWLAARCVELILPMLERPHIRRFVSAEIAAAGGRTQRTARQRQGGRT